MKIGGIEFPKFGDNFKWYVYGDGSDHVALDYWADLEDPDTCDEDWIDFRVFGGIWKWASDYHQIIQSGSKPLWHPVGKATPKTIIRKVTARRLGIG